jgi:hypothetical protein
MSQPNDSAASRHDDGEDEFPDGLEGVDWSAVGRIEGDEPETTAQVQISVPGEGEELPPRLAPSSSWLNSTKQRGCMV